MTAPTGSPTGPSTGPSATSTSAPPSPTATAPAETINALQAALAAEHAAVWTLQLVTAFLPDEHDGTVAAAATAHRARRDATERLLRDHGVTPVPAEPAYTSPEPVTDAPSSLAVLVAVEADAAAGWRSVIDWTDDRELRQAALDGLTEAAVRAARWRLVAGTEPVTTAFPGQP